MLQSLGISSDAEAVYLVLAQRGTATTEDLAETSTAYDAEGLQQHLRELVGVGLAAELGTEGWRALPLVDGVRILRERREAELRAATAAAESMQNYLLAAARNQSDDDSITVLLGTDAIVEARDGICEDAKKEICFFDKPPYVDNRAAATVETLSASSPEWQALGRGIIMRCVYHPGFDSDRLAELSLFAAQGEKSRTAQVPMKLLLADTEVALIPSMRSYDPGQELRASVVRHPQLVEALVWLFESVWDQSVPIMASGYNDPRRQMLISLLMTGSTDSAIATQLGINVRSVRRWISELMDELGVTTRLQLGAALVRSDSLNLKRR
jgi:DNA-binding CsgD family transcriptional regulator